VPADEYWCRRAELGEREVNRRMIGAAGVSDWLVDTGLRAADVLGVHEMSTVSGAAAHEIVRTEAVAEGVIQELDDPLDYADAFCGSLARQGEHAVGAKTVIAYRIGFDHDLSRPSVRDVGEAAGRWRDRIDAGAAVRLTDPILLSYGIHAAIELNLPLQIHVGFGDRDLDLSRANPLLLLDFLRAHESTGVPVLLLHCYPFEREAGYLAQAFEAVHIDVGLATNFVGARSRSLIARSLELAPFGKVLYSSDACGPAELHYLGARLWRTGMGNVLAQWIDEGHWSERDARRIANMVGRDNARRIYRLP